MAEPNKPYGLVLRGKHALTAAGRAPKPAAFGSDESDNDDVDEAGPTVRPPPSLAKHRPAVTAKEKRSTKLQHAQALAEDPTIFDYDAAYDRMRESQSKVEADKRVGDKERKPKYMDKLMRSAKQRELERVAREERKQHKERIEEAGQFDDKEVFVTGSYRKQMEELQTYREDEASRDLVENAMAVSKQRDLSGFYKHFLNDMIDDRAAPPPAKADNDDDGDHADVKPDAGNVKPEVGAGDAPATSGGAAKGEVKAKEKSYRRRRRTTNSSSGGEEHEHEAAAAHKPSIYSDSDEDDGRPHTVPAESPTKGGLQVPRRKVDRSAASGETRAAQRARRYFTPEPESDGEAEPGGDAAPAKDAHVSPEKNGAKEAGGHRSRSASPARAAAARSPGPEEQEEEGEEKKPVDPAAERMRKLRVIFARKTTDEELQEYRKRYFERKANGLIVPPV